MRRRIGGWLFVVGVSVTTLGVALWCASLWIVSYRSFKPEFTAAAARGDLWLTTEGTYYGPGFRATLGRPSLEHLVWWPQRGLQTDLSRGWSVAFPIWWIAAAGSGAAIAGWALRRGGARGVCDGCGYSLEGIAGVCPECGTMRRT